MRCRDRSAVLNLCCGLVTLLAVAALRADEGGDVHFERHQLSDRYYCDGVAAGDINADGHPDIVAGPFWYEGPDFRQAHEFYEAVVLPPQESPSNSMFSFVRDFNHDGRLDILVLGRVHKHPAVWYENTGRFDELWPQHHVFERVRGESPTLVDLHGDGVPHLISHWDGRWGSLAPDPQDPVSPWKFHPVGEDEQWPQFYHGEGSGDLNADGRIDLLLNDGWYEHPPAPSESWTFHRGRFSLRRGGAQMFVDDVDGDGDQDVISALHGHEWGLAWFERVASGTEDADSDRPVGEDWFREHLIMDDRSREQEFGVAFSQVHALDYADIDGDGHRDIVTGKRMWAHGPAGDVEPNADPVVYWFQYTRTPDGQVRFVPHEVDRRSGVGVQIQVVDVNLDGRADILTASKLGTFLFLNRSTSIAE